MPSVARPCITALALSALLLNAQEGSALNGHYLEAVGPVNKSMGGASTASFLEPFGVLTWNPAGSVRLEGTTIGVNFEALFPELGLGSSAEAGAFGPGVPATDTSAVTKDRSKQPFLPGFAYTRRLGSGDKAWHVGVLAIAGFSSEYRASSLADPNPNVVVTPQAPNGVGFGKVESYYALVKVPIGMSFEISDKAAIGFSAVPAYARVGLNPLVVLPPDDANGDGFPTYPELGDKADALGFGASFGLHYQATPKFGLGFAIHSPVWFEDFEFSVTDELGARRKGDFSFDAPGFVTAGIEYRPRDTTIFAADVRWIAFGGTDGLEGRGFAADGSLLGLGWQDSWVIGLGLSQQLGEEVTLRFGYNFGESPVPEELTFLNSASLLLTEHHASVGLSWEITDRISFEAAYVHTFEETIRGAYLASDLSEIPGTEVEGSAGLETLAVGLTIRF